jgi:hypothetical protein
VAEAQREAGVLLQLHEVRDLLVREVLVQDLVVVALE